MKIKNKHNGERKNKIKINSLTVIIFLISTLIILSNGVLANIAWENPITNPESQIIYGTTANYQFNLDWKGIDLPKTVWIENNFNGTKTKILTTTHQNFTFSYLTNNIPAGTYNWNFIAEDTNNKIFSSDNYTYIIQKAQPIINLLLDSSEASKLIAINQEVNIVGLNPYNTEGKIDLYIEGELIDSNQNIIDINKVFDTPGTYEIKLVYAKTSNYDRKEIVRWIEVINNTQSFQITQQDLNTTPPTTTPINLDNQTNQTNTSQDGISWSNASTNPASQAMYNTSANYTFSVTWSANNTIDTVSIEHNFTGNITTETIINNSNSSIYTYSIQNLPAGTYYWQMSANDSQNNQNTTDKFNFTVQKAQPNIELYLNSEENSITIDQNSTVNITGKKLTSEGSIELLIDGVTIGINQSNITNVSKFTDTNKHNITLKYNETENYTSAQVDYEITIIPLTFNLTLNKNSYSLGETATYTLNFPTNATINVDICGPIPEEGGFVTCYTQTTISEQSSPYQATHKYTNKTGKYTVSAIASYKSRIFSETVNYTVDNTISTTINGDKKVYSYDPIDLTASASGGFAPYTYVWKLANGTTINERELEARYDEVGIYPTNLTVTDNLGNIKKTEFNINVRKWNNIYISVKDKNTDEPIESASVIIDNNIKLTNSSGIAYFKIYPDTYDISINAYQYIRLNQEVSLLDNQTISYKLSPVGTSTNNDIIINQISPDDNTIQANTVTLSANIVTSTNATCSIYLTAKTDSWSKEVKNAVVDSNTYLEAINVNVDSGKEYSWFVECKKANETYTSGTRKFTTSQKVQASTTSINIVDAGQIRQKLQTAMENLDSLDITSKKTAESMQLRTLTEKKLTEYDRILRDINNIQFRKDLTEEQKDEKRLEYQNNLKLIEEETPLNIITEKTEAFVNYPKKEKLIQISSEYANITKHTGTLNVETLQNLQNQILVKTTLSHVEIQMLNGNKKKITLIDKQITYTGNLSDDTFIIESIPKDTIKTAEQITSLVDNTVLNNDPLLKFNKEEKITYYVEGYKDFDSVKRISTIAFSNLIYESGKNSITGNVIFENITPTSTTSLIIFLLIIIIIYITYSYGLVEKAVTLTTSKFKKKKINKITILINDSFNYLNSGNLDQANFIFNEVKLSYEAADEETKKETFSQATKLHDAINKSYFEKLVVALNNKQLSPEEKEKLTKAYDLLNDSDKNDYTQTMKKILNQ